MDEEAKVKSTIQLSELSCLKLTAAQLAIEKAKMSLQLISGRLRELQAEGVAVQQQLKDQLQKYEDLRKQTAEEYEVSSLEDYHVDLATGVGVRRS